MNINDGSNDRPKVVVYAHSWALQELPRLPHARTWSWDEALDNVVAAGFDGVQAEPERARDILARRLRFAAGGRANGTAEVNELIERCKDVGAECVTIHLGWGDEDDVATTRLAESVLIASERVGLPAYIETHRATIVQDLWRTLRLIERLPEIRFNGDYSHYYCGGEVPYRGFESFQVKMRPVLERTCFFHGRVSNGQAMQVSIADPANAVHLACFTELWQHAMRAWRQHAHSGDILPFVPELGPPSSEYSLTYSRADERVEIVDRWQETLRLAEIARTTFRAPV